MVSLFETILYQPIFNLFVALYNVVGDVGIVIFLITIAIKLILYPLTKSSLESQKNLKELQPKLEKIKDEYDDQEKVAQETMKLYKENQVNPFGSCIPILVQIPIFLALYWVLQDGLGTEDFHLLYSFVTAPEQINPISLGLFNLAEKGNWILAGMAALAQLWQTQTMKKSKPEKADESGEGAKDESMLASMNKMLYFMPIITFFIGYKLPGGVALYWFLSTFTTAAQQKFLYSTSDSDEDEEKDSSEKKEDKIDSKKDKSKSEKSNDDEEVIEGEIVD